MSPITTPPWELQKPKRPKVAYLSPSLRDSLWRRAGGRDEVTGERLNPAQWDAHHRVKKSQGRDDRPCNLLVVSRKTHDMLGKREAWAREHGFVVSAYSDPADVAIVLHCERYVLLTDDFTYVDGERGEVL